jgi:hypothetical protein
MHTLPEDMPVYIPLGETFNACGPTVENIMILDDQDIWAIRSNLKECHYNSQLHDDKPGAIPVLEIDVI